MEFRAVRNSSLRMSNCSSWKIIDPGDAEASGEVGADDGLCDVDRVNGMLMTTEVCTSGSVSCLNDIGELR